ncbi:glycerate kinase [Annulohypoxylon maeteangense]|uniref:glycerate kinase n=1 Tax=Annulohypoxylon maeteangense TaxID=1927788 RepID=UPI0020085032|nr:glycerate kinase [Annulohypoxylon maeteangense]KAI0881619.1 glycerate kinase [Annulohypoxylon maeteangense]
MRPLRVIIAPSGIEEDLEADKVADCIEKGIREGFPGDDALVRKIPLYDDKDFIKSFLALHNCEIYCVTINNPFCYAVESWFWTCDDGSTALVDLKAVAGSHKIPDNCLDLIKGTSYGVGELLNAALDAGCTKIIISCDSFGALDGGAGMLQALGARLFDISGKDILTIGGGPELTNLSRIDMSNIHPRLRNKKEKIRIEAVCPTMDVLCGSKGVALADGPQNQASMEQIEDLTLALEIFAEIVGNLLGEDVGSKPGSGVSGGLGTGLMLLGAKFRTTPDAASKHLDLEKLFTEPWDVVFTGARSLSSLDPKAGKAIEIARRARNHGVAVMAVAKTIGDDRPADLFYKGFTSFTGISEDCTLGEPQVEYLIEQAVGRFILVIQIGLSLHR